MNRNESCQYHERQISKELKKRGFNPILKERNHPGHDIVIEIDGQDVKIEAKHIQYTSQSDNDSFILTETQASERPLII